jgi:hypothetical protein
MREGEVERGKRPRGGEIKGRGKRRGMGVRGVREAVTCDEDVGVACILWRCVEASYIEEAR